MLYFSDPDLQASFINTGWLGQILQPQCPSQLALLPCQVDSLAIIDSNIGINKANAYLKRLDEHTVEISREKIKHERTITLQNTANSNAWPKGPYKSYLRFYLPRDSQNLSLKVNNQVVAPEKLKKSYQDNWLILGLVTETAIQSQTKINLTFTLDLNQDASQPFSYAFFNQKQSGFDNPLSRIIFKYDESLQLSTIAPQAQVSRSSLIFDDTPEDHFFVGASFK